MQHPPTTPQNPNAINPNLQTPTPKSCVRKWLKYGQIILVLVRFMIVIFSWSLVWLTGIIPLLFISDALYLWLWRLTLINHHIHLQTSWWIQHHRRHPSIMYLLRIDNTSFVINTINTAQMFGFDTGNLNWHPATKLMVVHY